MGSGPGLDVKMPCVRSSGYLKSGYTHVVDADLKAYFDSISHDLLMKDVRSRIADGRVLDLIEMFLKQGGTGGHEAVDAGTRHSSRGGHQSVARKSFLALGRHGHGKGRIPDGTIRR